MKLIIRPVVTGIGMITANGVTATESWCALQKGCIGLGNLSLFNSARYGHMPVGQINEDINILSPLERGSRSDKLAAIAMQEALSQAGILHNGKQPYRDIGIVVGSTVGGSYDSEKFLMQLFRTGKMYSRYLKFHKCSSSADRCAELWELTGPRLTVSTACSSGALAIAVGIELIRKGELHCVVAGGTDSLCRLAFNGFGSLLLLDPEGCRPFDSKRQGISVGEGSAFLVIESETRATARGVQILADAAGWGASCDAYHTTAPHPEGRGAQLSMKWALADAGLKPEDIDYLNAHGTGTKDNDLTEAKAICRVFSNKMPLIASTKRFFGHALGASGAIEAALCVMALNKSGVPPNAGMTNPDHELGFEPITNFIKKDLTHVMTNSFGFGGNNATLIFSKRDTAKNLFETNANDTLTVNKIKTKRIAIIGRGIVSPAGNDHSSILSACLQRDLKPSLKHINKPFPQISIPVYACEEFNASSALPPSRRRKLCRLQQMLIVAAMQADMESSGGVRDPERTGVTTATGWGCLHEAVTFIENLFGDSNGFPLPLTFTNSVHNALASQVAIEMNAHALNLTTTHDEIGFDGALWYAVRGIETGRFDHVFAGAADEINPYILAAGHRWKWWSEKTNPLKPMSNNLSKWEQPLTGEGATMFLLACEQKTKDALAYLNCVNFGTCSMIAAGKIDSESEARWIADCLQRENISLMDIDLVLTGANGHETLDRMYADVVNAVSHIRGKNVNSLHYKQCCGNYYSAPAFGVYMAICLVRGELISRSPDQIERRDIGTDYDQPAMVLVYTLSVTGIHSICCVMR